MRTIIKPTLKKYRCLMLFFFCFFSISNAFAADRIVNLVVGYKTVNFTGKNREAIVVNNQIPAPTLHFKQGDHVTINVYNHLDKGTSIHWHGIILPWQMDGVEGISQKPIPPGGVFHYRFTLHQSGTYWYHAHANVQEQEGLYGAFIIDPPKAPSYKYTKDDVVVLSDWSNTPAEKILANLKKEGDYYSPEFPLQPSLMKFIHDYRKSDSVERKKLIDDYKMMQQMRMSIYDISDVAYDAYLLNGKTKNNPWVSKVSVGDVVRLRFIGAMGSTIYRVKLSNEKMEIVQVDGNDVKPHRVDNFTIASGETYDVLVKIKNNQPTLIYAESLDTRGVAIGALVTHLNQKIDYKSVAPFPEPKPVTQDMMANMMMSSNPGSMNMNKENSQKTKTHSSMKMDSGMKMDHSMPMNHSMPMKKKSAHKMNPMSKMKMDLGMKMDDSKPIDHSMPMNVSSDASSKSMDKSSSSMPTTNTDSSSMKMDSGMKMDHSMPMKSLSDTTSITTDKSSSQTTNTDSSPAKMDENMPMDHSSMPMGKASDSSSTNMDKNSSQITNTDSSSMKIDGGMKMDKDKPMDHSMPMKQKMVHKMSSMSKKKMNPGMKMADNMPMNHSMPMTMSSDHSAMNMKMDHSMNMSMPTEPSIIGDTISPPGSFKATTVGTKYQNLIAAVKTNNPNTPVTGIIRMELFGYMDRFIWFINGLPEYKAHPIIIEPGKRYRIIFTNNSMMRHPMHIHGHWFILRNGHGAYDPLLHTIEVPPGATAVADVDTDASGQWFFHCHHLYHMMTGMSRVFQYSTLINIVKNNAKPETDISQTAYINRPIVRVDEQIPIDPSLVNHPMAHPMGWYFANFLDVSEDPFNNAQEARFKGLYGSDYNKLELFSNDAEINKGKIENADLDVFYWHLLNQFWAIKGGVNYFYRPAMTPYWQPGIAIEGLMPYFIDTDIRAYYHDGSAKLDAELSRDTQITNNFFIRLGIRSILATSTVTQDEVGSGLNQMRYIIRPYYRVMPGLNVFSEFEHEQNYGAFKNLQSIEGEPSSQNTVTFGLSMVF